MILYNPAVQTLNADNHFIPTVHISYVDGVTLLERLRSGPRTARVRFILTSAEDASPRFDAARRLGRTAVVVLRLLIDEQGNVAEVQQSGAKAGMGFDRAAILAAEKTTWQPAMVGDVPVKMWVDLRIEFKP